MTATADLVFTAQGGEPLVYAHFGNRLWYPALPLASADSALVQRDIVASWLVQERRSPV